MNPSRQPDAAGEAIVSIPTDLIVQHAANNTDATRQLFTVIHELVCVMDELQIRCGDGRAIAESKHTANALISLCERVQKLARVKRRRGQSLRNFNNELIKRTQNLAELTHTILISCAISETPVNVGDRFHPRNMVAERFRPGNERNHMSVADIIEPGYILDDRPLKPAIVEIYIE